MLKEYTWRGSTWQFEESQAPHDAVEVKAKQAPKNKSRQAPASKIDDADVASGAIEAEAEAE